MLLLFSFFFFTIPAVSLSVTKVGVAANGLQGLFECRFFSAEAAQLEDFSDTSMGFLSH